LLILRLKETVQDYVSGREGEMWSIAQVRPTAVEVNFPRGTIKLKVNETEKHGGAEGHRRSGH